MNRIISRPHGFPRLREECAGCNNTGEVPHTNVGGTEHLGMMPCLECCDFEKIHHDQVMRLDTAARNKNRRHTTR